MTTKHYKHPRHKHVTSNEDLDTPVGRFAWPSLVEPKAGMPLKDGTAGAPRYEITLCIPKTSKKIDYFLQELERLKDELLEMYNDKNPAKLSEVALLKDGDETDLEKYPYNKDCWIMVARNSQDEFQVVDKDHNAIDPSMILGGMKGRLLIRPLVTAHGLSFKLDVVQLTLDDGVRFGGGVRNPARLLEALPPLDDDDEEVEGEVPEDAETLPEETEQEPPPMAAKTVTNQRFNPSQMRQQMAQEMQTNAKAKAAQGTPLQPAQAAPKAPGKTVGAAPMKGKAAALARL